MSAETTSEKRSKTVEIQYFALLRERRGRGEETMETSAATARELFGELNRAYGFGMEIDHLRVAVNDAFAEWDTQLNAGDRVAFIPPVAGG